MKTTAIVINWVMLALAGAAFIVMVVRDPGLRGIGGALLLGPYAFTLLALKAPPNRGLAGAGMLCNLIVVAFCLFGIFAAFTGRLEQPAMAILASIVLLVPSVINSKLLVNIWERARLGAQPN